MVVDTSAIFAMIAKEPEARAIQEAILSAETLLMSAITRLETQIVLHGRFGPDGDDAFEEWLSQSGIVIVPFDQEQARVAFAAFREYGKGQGHAAQLHICDCAAYALARTRGDQLLFKGGDFARTDIRSAL
jgi:ribonuclease VapC